ncbi:CHAD domain-containing protein [Rhodovulum sp. ES.010]|uniref:CHAD domain-containing protein n=1 Tax=Rhodovulum sp. ES.010 TaxID=1882821 RepID=UPI0009282A66|nr:CHAD domain-containing protein [Rhodovulum sp. ES.010]SIO50739.1 CHAD domain-containing protein [Rhodovulum sp. ES.010]
MAYRIKDSDDSLQDAVRRIADEQIARALGEIDDPDLAFNARVHQVRKRCKKLRGLVRLVRPAFDGYADENTAFRDASRRISAVRDADTLIETYDAVTAHFEDQIDRRSFASIRARLTCDATALRADPETARRLKTVRDGMEDARGRVADWSLDADGFDAIAGGLGKTYRQARKRMEEAWQSPTGEALHEWRKRVKYHWYHARLLGGVAPQMMAPHADAADEMSDLLGDHHDLVVLDAPLRGAPGDFGEKTDLDAFRGLMTRRREALARRAFHLGRLLLAERQKALVKRWGGYWTAWCNDEMAPERLRVKA